MSRQTLYVATSSLGKLRDFSVAAMQDSTGWTIATLPGLAAIAAPPEDGATFAENAAAKAIYYAEYAPGELVLADDSGLSVDALDGAPGVYSARYAEQLGFSSFAGETKDARNNHCLLAELNRRDVPPARHAQFRCALAVARDGVLLATAEGSVAGEIQEVARGTGGFGYDCLFLLPELGKTMAELDAETRLRLSHRGRRGGDEGEAGEDGSPVGDHGGLLSDG